MEILLFPFLFGRKFPSMRTHFADFRESSVMFCKSLNIPSQSLSTEVVLVDG